MQQASSSEPKKKNRTEPDITQQERTAPDKTGREKRKQDRKGQDRIRHNWTAHERTTLDKATQKMPISKIPFLNYWTYGLSLYCLLICFFYNYFKFIKYAIIWNETMLTISLLLIFISVFMVCTINNYFLYYLLVCLFTCSISYSLICSTIYTSTQAHIHTHVLRATYVYTHA